MDKSYEIIRLYYYQDTMPYSVDVGPALKIGDIVELDSISFEVDKIKSPQNEEIQRLGIKRLPTIPKTNYSDYLDFPENYLPSN